MPLINTELFTRASLDSLVKICGYLAVASVVYFFYCLYTVRMKFRRLKTEHGVVSYTPSLTPRKQGCLITRQ